MFNNLDGLTTRQLFEHTNRLGISIDELFEKESTVEPYIDLEVVA